ncbi:MAG: D-glycerate dehydrogenase [Anaerolineae bacterium]|nr:D-glycerate dehydrogenase [Anaerolineae bacterium]
MSRPRIYISRMIPERPLTLLREHCDVHIWQEDTPPPAEEISAQVQQADAFLSMLTEKVDRALIESAPSLKVICNYAVGYDNIDIAAATERGIPVGNTPGVLTEATADQAFTLLLAAARRLPEAIAYVQNGEWKTWNPIQLLGQELHGSTLGIIGLGRIGCAMARRAKGFGMRILYHGGGGCAEEVGAEATSLENLLRESDFISLHTPLTDKTRGLFGAEQFAMMKRSAILVNTARGGIIQTDALLQALQTRQIAFAALDVTDPEPLPADHPLLDLPNCIVAPHLGSATHATRTRMGEMVADDLLRGLRGERLEHCVNPEVYT